MTSCSANITKRSVKHVAAMPVTGLKAQNPAGRCQAVGQPCPWCAHLLSCHASSPASHREGLRLHYPLAPQQMVHPPDWAPTAAVSEGVAVPSQRGLLGGARLCLCAPIFRQSGAPLQQRAAVAQDATPLGQHLMLQIPAAADCRGLCTCSNRHSSTAPVCLMASVAHRSCQGDSEP